MTFVNPSSPADRLKIKQAIIEASNALVLIDATKDQLKSIRDAAKADFDLPPALFNELVQTYHKQTYGEKVAKQEAFQETYSIIFDVEA